MNTFAWSVHMGAVVRWECRYLQVQRAETIRQRNRDVIDAVVRQVEVKQSCHVLRCRNSMFTDRSSHTYIYPVLSHPIPRLVSRNSANILMSFSRAIVNIEVYMRSNSCEKFGSRITPYTVHHIRNETSRKCQFLKRQLVPVINSCFLMRLSFFFLKVNTN